MISPAVTLGAAPTGSVAAGSGDPTGGVAAPTGGVGAAGVGAASAGGVAAPSCLTGGVASLLRAPLILSWGGASANA